MRHRKKLRNRNYHHLKPKSRRGLPIDENLLLINVEKHKLIHKIFANATLGEILEILHRTLHAKGYEVVEACPICKETK